MRREWRFWKFLKSEEIGLGWDPVTEKIQAPKDWWERKIKEKPEAKKFLNKGLLPKIEELWNNLFQDGYATGADVVSISIDPSSVNVMNLEDEENDENVNENYESGNDVVYLDYYPRLDNLKSREQGFYSTLLSDVTSQVSNISLRGDWGTHMPNFGHDGGCNTQVSNQSPSNLEGRSDTKSGKQPQKCGTRNTKLIQMKCKGRQSSGSAMLSSHIGTMVNNCNRVLELMESDANPSSSLNTQSSSCSNDFC